jgi:hypothetical protein
VLSRRPQLLAIATDIGALGRGPAPLRALRQTYRKALVKAEYLCTHGAPNWMAALSARVPALETAWLGRNKFHHFPFWIRSQMAPFVRERLSGSNGRHLDAWFDMERVAMMVEEHISGRANYTDEIDKVLTVAELQRSLISDTARPSALEMDANQHAISS